MVLQVASHEACARGIKCLKRSNAMLFHSEISTKICWRNCRLKLGRSWASHLLQSPTVLSSSLADNLLPKSLSMAPAYIMCQLRSLRSATWVGCAETTETGSSHTSGIVPGRKLVWFKHDLRVDDQPGVAAAVGSGECVAAFVFDPAMYSHLLSTPSGIEGLVGAVTALREELQQRGSGLVVRQGPLAPTLLQLATETCCDEIVVEDEVEFRWHSAVLDVVAGIPDDMKLRRWQLDCYEPNTYCDNFREFRKRRGQLLPPQPPQELLPPLPAGISLGEIPQPATFGIAVAESAALRQHFGFVDVACRSLLSLEPWRHDMAAQLVGGEASVRKALDAYLSFDAASARGAENSPGSTSLAAALAAATAAGEAPSSPGGSFPAVFGQALSLGLLSRRRVAALAAVAEQSAKGERRLFSGSDRKAPVAAAAAAAKWSEAADFHWHLAATDRIRDTRTGDAARHWRWRGVLIDYYTADLVAVGATPFASADDVSSADIIRGEPLVAALASQAGEATPAVSTAGEGSLQGGLCVAAVDARPNAPAVLLVHGFGAFGEQWRGQILALTRAGYKVYAPTFPGYGRSEKPAVSYSAELWRDFLRDFVLEVVGRPVVVTGNSIGGYIGAALAADYPTLCAGLVLLNTAGQVTPGWQPADDGKAPKATVKSPPPRILVEALSRGLFLFLERSIPWNLSRLYPGDQTNADAWLAQEIYRAACDPGALSVFQSVFYLPKPRPLNHLVADLWGGPTLVLQGVLDPLNDAKGRAKAIAAACPNVAVQLVDAGHCPHDESPAAVNAVLLEFLAARSISISDEGGDTADSLLSA